MTLAQIQLLAGERQPRETDAAASACNDYLRMGIGRSVRDLQQKYSESSAEPPTKTLRVLFRWSSDFQWQERASAYDAAQDAAKTAEIERIRTEGLAADYERIRRLSRLAEDLEHQIFYRGRLNDEGDELANEGDDSLRYEGMQVDQRPHLWVRDVKQIGGGEFAREVVIYRYNSQLVSDYRGLIDDIAKEVGGRKERKEISGPDGGPIQLAAVESALLKTYGDDSTPTSG